MTYRDDIDSILDTRDADVEAVQASTASELALAQSTAETALASATQNQAVIDTLRAQIAAAQPPAGYATHYIFDYTKDQGFYQTKGRRANVDSTTNRAEQTSFGPEGMTIKAEVVDGVVYSSDAQARFAPFPRYFIYDVDVTMGGWIGMGCFPAFFWFKATDGSAGELDGVEFMPNHESAAYRWKVTAISLMPQTSPLKQVSKGIAAAVAKLDMTKKHRWRYAKTPGKIEVFIDGVSVASITREEFDAATKTPGLWDKNFENPAIHWYARHTYQFGPPTTKGYNAAGSIPKDFQSSSFTLARGVVYVPLA
jgi:hypothetical protein